MDPVPTSPPELLLDEGVVYFQQGALPSPQTYNYKPFEYDLHMSYETLRGDPVSSLVPQQSKINSPASEKLASVTELLQNEVELDQMNQQPVQHHLPSPVHLVQAYQSTFSVNLMSAVGPSPVNLHASSPFSDRVRPGLVPLLSSPSAPLNSHWMNSSLLPPLPHPSFCMSPSMLVPIINPAEFWSGPYLPPHLFKPEFPPSLCLCPPPVFFQQTSSPAMVWRSGESKQLNMNVTPGQGPLPCLEEELLIYENFKNRLMTTDFYCPTTQEYVEEDEKWKCKEKQNMVIGNHFFKEYLDELCSDEHFVRNVEFFLNDDFLDSLLSSDLGAMDFYALEPLQQEDTLHPLPGNNPVTEEASLLTTDDNGALQYLFSHPLSIKSEPNQTGLGSPKKEGSEGGWGAFSPPPISHLNEMTDATPESHVSNRFPTHEDICSSASAMIRLSSHSGPQKQTSQKTLTAGKKDDTKPKISDLRCSQSLPGPSNKERQVVIRAGEKSQVETSIIKTAEVTPRRSENCGNHGRPTGRRQLFKREESGTGTNPGPGEQFLKTAKEDKELTEMQKVQVPKGKPTNFCRELLENKACLSKDKKKTRKEATATSSSAADEERVQATPLDDGQTSPSERKVEINTKKTVREPQNLASASPTKRSRKSKDVKSSEVKVPSVSQPTQMCPHPEGESSTYKGDQKAPRKATKEGCEAKRPATTPSKTKGPESSVQCPGSGEVETKPEDFKPKVSKRRKNRAGVESRAVRDVKGDEERLLEKETEQLKPDNPVKKHQIKRGGRNRKMGVNEAERLMDNVETRTENPQVEFDIETRSKRSKGDAKEKETKAKGKKKSRGLKVTRV